MVDLLRDCGAAMHDLGSSFAARAGIHPTDLQALDRLARYGPEPPTVGELGAALDLSSAAVTELVDRLARGGHVERFRDDVDGRRVRVRMTRRAHALAQDVFQTYGARLRASLAGFGEEELATIAAFLSAATAAASERPPTEAR